MTLSRINHLGAAAQTTLNGSITAAATSATLTSGTGYPTSNFVIKIDAGTSSEEKILVGARSGTAISSLTRGYDGTTAASHSTGATVEHDLAAVVIDDANDHIYTTTRDDHTQYLRTDGTRATTGAQTIGGALTVSSGGAAITGNSTVTGTLTVSSTITSSADDAAWTNVSAFTNSWAATTDGVHAVPGYRKVGGRVYLRGAAVSGTHGSSAFTLPTGYRPSKSLVYAQMTDNGSTLPTSVGVGSDGTVIPGSGTYSTVWFDGISFDLL